MLQALKFGRLKLNRFSIATRLYSIRAMSSIVETVTGPISANQLGKTLIHEHFIFGYPGFQGDVTLGSFNEEAALKEAVEIAQVMASHGVDTVVDPTPNECGRNPLFLKKVSEATGLQII